MFNSTEHKFLGNHTLLPGLTQGDGKLTLFNGLTLSFGEILALSGDYYAVAKHPICLGIDNEDKRKRFLEAYSTLAHSDRSKVRNILDSISEADRLIDHAIKHGQAENVAAKKYRLKEIVKALIYTHFEVIAISEMGLDHMEDNALIVYQIGHQLAMETAAQAHNIYDAQQKEKQLAYAYTLEAFACHFLTDRFSSGHIRTPTNALFFEFGPALSSILMMNMHDEENELGLNVTNTNGTNWKTYGDGYFFEEANQVSKEILYEVLSIAIDDVYQAYLTGKVETNFYSQVYRYIPHPTDNNFAPMFKENHQSQHLQYRKDLDDINCQEYKKLNRPKALHVMLHELKNSIKKKDCKQKPHDASKQGDDKQHDALKQSTKPNDLSKHCNNKPSHLPFFKHCHKHKEKQNEACPTQGYSKHPKHSKHG